MQPMHFVAIIVRIFAIGLFIYSIERFALIFIPYSLESDSYLYYLASFTGSLIAIVLWIFPTFIAKKVVPLEPNSLSHDKLNTNDWYRLAFVTLGVFMLLSVISDFFYWITYLHFMKEQVSSYTFATDTAENKAAVISTLFELVLAVAFIFGSKRLISLIRATQVKK